MENNMNNQKILAVSLVSEGSAASLVGCTVVEDVWSRDGSLLCKKKTKLTEKTIENMLSRDVSEVKIIAEPGLVLEEIEAKEKPGAQPLPRQATAVKNQTAKPEILEVSLFPDNLDSLVGCTVAEDVWSKDGSLLCKKQTKLTPKLVQNILFRDVGAIKILAEPDLDLVEVETDFKIPAQPKRILKESPVFQETIFRKFDQERKTKIEVIKGQLHDISNGAKADVGQLHQLTSDVIGKLNRRNDVLNYIRYLAKTDDATYGHSINVSMLCNLFAHWLEMDDEEIVILTAAGALHDIGKTRIPPSILQKPSRLTDEEFAIVKEHTVKGYEVLLNQDLPEEVKLAALSHHEKIDGRGYPRGITAEKIGKYASIVAICDIYDAMISKRHYKEELSPFYVIQSFEQKMYGDLDTTYLLIFLKNIAHTFLHSRAELSDGREGEVMFIHEHNLSRPIVRCGDEFVDLIDRSDLSIEKVY